MASEQLILPNIAEKILPQFEKVIPLETIIDAVKTAPEISPVKMENIKKIKFADTIQLFDYQNLLADMKNSIFSIKMCIIIVTCIAVIILLYLWRLRKEKNEKNEKNKI